MRTGILHSTGFYVASGGFMFFLSREATIFYTASHPP